MATIEEILKEYTTKFNSDLEKYFPQLEGEQYKAFKAMYYSLANGGKRLRPFLLHETASLFGVDYKTALPVAVSLEMLHTYSLIHDDLPAMDNDDLRRGKPTCHKAFDEATAILAGDGLLTYAFEVLNKAEISDDKKVLLSIKLAELAGAKNGMIAGQVLDIYGENAQILDKKEDLIKLTQSLKTGCLLKYPCLAGCILGNASKDDENILIKFSHNIGLAFQISDDILDIIGDEKLVGKTLKKDKKQNKLNFVSIYGVDKAREIAKELIDEAIGLLDKYGKKANALKLLSRYILTRNH
ncbi:MAG: polyprenyl synthetase family protein [Alphaproteobacteria bacterium]|nr:polyprenyl synthetase family protein [Alphaproteobacteria bacterium]